MAFFSSHEKAARQQALRALASQQEQERAANLKHFNILVERLLPGALEHIRKVFVEGHKKAGVTYPSEEIEKHRAPYPCPLLSEVANRLAEKISQLTDCGVEVSYNHSEWDPTVTLIVTFNDS